VHTFMDESWDLWLNENESWHTLFWFKFNVFCFWVSSLCYFFARTHAQHTCANTQTYTHTHTYMYAYIYVQIRSVQVKIQTQMRNFFFVNLGAKSVARQMLMLFFPPVFFSIFFCKGSVSENKGASAKDLLTFAREVVRL